MILKTNEEIGKTINYYMKKQDMTSRDLIKIMNDYHISITEAGMSKILSGKTGSSLEKYFIIAKIFKISLDELFIKDYVPIEKVKIKKFKSILDEIAETSNFDLIVSLYKEPMKYYYKKDIYDLTLVDYAIKKSNYSLLKKIILDTLYINRQNLNHLNVSNLLSRSQCEYFMSLCIKNNDLEMYDFAYDILTERFSSSNYEKNQVKSILYESIIDNSVKKETITHLQEYKPYRKIYDWVSISELALKKHKMKNIILFMKFFVEKKQNEMHETDAGYKYANYNTQYEEIYDFAYKNEEKYKDFYNFIWENGNKNIFLKIAIQEDNLENIKKYDNDLPWVRKRRYFESLNPNASRKQDFSRLADGKYELAIKNIVKKSIDYIIHKDNEPLTFQEEVLFQRTKSLKRLIEKNETLLTSRKIDGMSGQEFKDFFTNHFDAKYTYKIDLKKFNSNDEKKTVENEYKDYFKDDSIKNLKLRNSCKNWLKNQFYEEAKSNIIDKETIEKASNQDSFGDYGLKYAVALQNYDLIEVICNVSKDGIEDIYNKTDSIKMREFLKKYF